MLQQKYQQIQRQSQLPSSLPPPPPSYPPKVSPVTETTLQQLPATVIPPPQRATMVRGGPRGRTLISTATATVGPQGIVGVSITNSANIMAPPSGSHAMESESSSKDKPPENS
jgi:hypothetical protein